MTTTLVGNGVTSTGLTESGNGNILEVQNGGSAVATTVVNGGVLQVDNGGYATNTTVSSGGSENVLSGGTTDNVFVSSGGTLNVLGTVLSFTTVSAGGVENISAGGRVTGESGSGTGIFGVANLLAGGEVDHLRVFSGGVFNVHGSVLSNLAVNSGGVINVFSGGTLSGVTGSGTGVSGGTLNILSGGYAADEAVFSGGVENVSSGGSIGGSTGSGTGVSGGTLNLLAGATASYVGVYSGGVFNVYGKVLSEGGVASGGIENVQSGGFISGATSSGTGVSAGGILNILAGGSAVHVGVSSGGIFNVHGTTLSNTVVWSGGVENVDSGGLVTGAFGSGNSISSGGTVNVLAGGSATFMAVSSGGTLNVAGTADEVNVFDNGLLVVSSGGVAGLTAGTGIGVNGGAVDVLSGGLLAFSTDFAGGVTNISAGGSAHNVAVSSGGMLNVAGTVLSNSWVYSGGVETVLSGGLVTGNIGLGTAISGGTVNVSSGGHYEYSTVFSGGQLNVSAGGIADHISVSNGGVFNVAGTVLSNTAIFGGGIENVSSGGFISGTSSAGTGVSGGTLNLLAGGSAAHVGVYAGGIFNVYGSMLSNTAVSSGGTEYVYSGGTISGVLGSGTGVYAGGLLNIMSGGYAADEAVYTGGIENVSSGGFISGSTGSGTGVSGGTLNLLFGGSAAYVGVYSGGQFNISGTVIDHLSVSSGGVATVFSGASIGPATIAGGQLELKSGSVANGGFTFTSAGGVLKIDSASMPSNIISGLAPGDKIDLAGVTFVAGASASIQGGNVLDVVDNGVHYDLNLNQNPGAGFSVTQDSGTGTLVTVTTPTAPSVNVTSDPSATADQTIALSNLVTVSDPDSAGYQVLQLWDSDGTVVGGEFLINGVAQSAGGPINVPAGANVVFEVGTGSGTDTMWAQLIENNGTPTGWDKFTVTVPAPTLSVTSIPTTAAGAQIALSSLVTVSDPSNATYQLQLWDSDGTVAGGEFLINGVTQSAGGAINVPAGANVVFDAGTGSGTDTMWAQLIPTNGTATGWEKFTVTVPAPTLSVTSIPTTTAGAQIALSSLVTVSDPSSATYQLQLWDSDGTVAGGEFLINGVAQTAGHAINVPSGANVVFDAGTGAGTDTMWAQLIQSNGTATGWEKFTVTVPAPTLSVTSIPGATAGAQIALSSLVTVSDPSSATYQLQLWDSDGTVAGGEFLINGVAQTAGHAINVPSGANVVFDAGTGSGTDTMWAQLIQSNGTATGWEKFTATVAAPTLSVTATTNTTARTQIALASLVTVSDPSNATYQLQLWDSDGTVAGGEFLINGVAQTAGHAINVPAGANVVFDAGTSGGTDTLWAQIVQSNGTATGWDKFTVTVPNPTVAVHNDTTVTPGQTISLSTLVTISDPGHAGYQMLELWDSDGTAATGQFVVNGTPQTGGHAINVTPGDVAGVVFDEGTSGNTDTLWAQLQLNNGTLTGWQKFTVTDPVHVAQGATLELTDPYAGQAVFDGNSGTLQLDQSAGFSGTVAGMSGADTLDLRDIGFGSSTTLGFTANASHTGGTLSVSDGALSANIALLGQYSASSFAKASDGHGGTLISEASVSAIQQTPLTQPHQA